MNKKSGFSLLEMLVVILIIGVLGAVILPNLKRSTPRYEREEFIARFNALTQLAWQQALVTNRMYQISVDIGKKVIFLLAGRDATIPTGISRGAVVSEKTATAQQGKREDTSNHVCSPSGGWRKHSCAGSRKRGRSTAAQWRRLAAKPLCR